MQPSQIRPVLRALCNMNQMRSRLIEGVIVLAIIGIVAAIIYRFFGIPVGVSSEVESNFFESAVGAALLGTFFLVCSIVEFRSLKYCYEQVAVRVYKVLRSVMLFVISMVMFSVSYNAL